MKTQERTKRAVSGYLMLMVLLLMIFGAVFSYMNEIIWLGVILSIAVFLTGIGFTVVNQNE